LSPSADENFTWRRCFQMIEIEVQETEEVVAAQWVAT
jgi:hypothetical protein